MISYFCTLHYQSNYIFLFLAEPDFIKKLSRFDKGIIVNWSLTQSLPLSQQLTYGIRYFDMRPGYLASKDDFLFVHGVYGHPIADLLNQINSFLKANPREVVIIDFNHFYSFTDVLHRRFIKSILSIFGDLILTKNDNGGSGVKTTLCEFWSLNKQVFIRYTSSFSDQHVELWPSSVISSPWFNTDSINTLITKLNDNFANLDDKKLNIFQAILTPQTSTIIQNLCSTLRDALVKKGDVAVKQWLADIYSQRKKGVNIVICDFACLNLCTPPIILLNDIHTGKNRDSLW